jgi:antitoxin ParD1/3/4
MDTINVSLPGPMKDWVNAQAETGKYSNASDYVRDLIRRDQERYMKIAKLQQLVDEGLASGISEKSMSEMLEAARIKAGGSAADNGL